MTKNWLLLRGLARERRHWGEFPEHLEAALGEDSKIFFLDLPGTGTESRRFSPLSIRGIVEDLRQRWIPLRKQHNGEWNVVGLSLGGMVAMDWCGRHPFEFKRMVCINSSSAMLSRPDKRLKPQAYVHLAQIVAGRTPKVKESAVLKMVSNRKEIWPQTVETWSRIAAQTPVKPIAALAQLLAATWSVAPNDLTPACLFLTAANDGMVDPECSRVLSEHFHAPLKTHPTAGHELTLDDPKWVAKQIEEWLAATSVE